MAPPLRTPTALRICDKPSALQENALGGAHIPNNFYRHSLQFLCPAPHPGDVTFDTGLLLSLAANERKSQPSQ